MIIQKVRSPVSLIVASRFIALSLSSPLGALRDGIVRIYNENAATNKVYARITGYWTSDRTSADGRYLIIGNEGNEFVVTDGQGVYKTGEQIITSGDGGG